MSKQRSGHFNEGRMIMLKKSPVQWRENGHVTEVVSIMEREGHVT